MVDDGHAQLGRLYAFLLMFMASMLGLVLADNLGWGELGCYGGGQLRGARAGAA